jgi:hypothetical protein
VSASVRSAVFNPSIVCMGRTLREFAGDRFSAPRRGYGTCAGAMGETTGARW